MKLSLLPLIALSCLVAFGFAADEKKPDPHPTTITFYIDNVGCEACVESITEALKDVRSVTAIAGLTADSGFANVSFDSHVNSYHEIAHAIATAPPSHGKPYIPSIRLSIPDYAKGDNSAKVDAVFAKQSTHVKVEATDKAKGDFVVYFLPLQLDRTRTTPQGFNGGHFGHPIHDGPPKGLGLKFAIAREKVPSTPPASANK